MTRRFHVPWVLSAALAFAGTTWGNKAHADPVTPPDSIERAETVGPNRALLRAGLWTLGISYVPAALVAVESSEPVDDNLYIPVAGPWIDYARRECTTCSHEKMNKALLVTDGVFQGLGALQILGSFVLPHGQGASAGARSAAAGPQKRTKSSLQLTKLTPARFETGAYGLAARGCF